MNTPRLMFPVVAIAALGQSSLQAQPPVPPAATRPAAAAPAHPAPLRTAVIDVGFIFKNHTRFKEAIDKMKGEVMAAEKALTAERDRINVLLGQLKLLQVGTPEYRKREAEVAKAQGDFNVSAQLQKKDFMEREAKVYLQFYTEIEQAVGTFARQNGFAVVHRFDGEEVDNNDRNRILGSITKSIVYHDPKVDITLDILQMLNGISQPRPPR